MLPMVDRSSFVATAHARRRQAQRAVSEGDLRYALEHGTLLRRRGADCYVLRAKDIEPADHKALHHLSGLVVVADADVVITTYRAGRVALRAIRRQPKYRCA